MLTLYCSDGASCLEVNFALLSPIEAQNHLFRNHRSEDRRCCIYQRRSEATMKATEHLQVMVNRALQAGLSARYLMMDSRLTMPASAKAPASILAFIGSDGDLPPAEKTPGQSQDPSLFAGLALQGVAVQAGIRS